ncbi:MAG: ABC-type transport auxiliary lipoprotein family protein [Nitrospirota bacterium]
MVSRGVQTVIGALVATTLAACLSPRSESGPIHTYLLRAEEFTWADKEPVGRTAASPVLLVGLPQAEAGFDTPRMAYVTRPYEVRYYAVNQWADTPARMLAPLLVQALEKSGVWQAVIPMPSSFRGDYRLDTLDVALEQQFLETPSRVRVALRAQLIDLKEPGVIGTRRFEVFEPAPSEDAYGGALGANRAVTKLLDQIARWAVACLSKHPDCTQ